jgi:4-methyl-5(b-hydroxyethyl)-thiazole monophosphate biosynthesis
MKGIVILGNGFEDTEAIATIDVLKRSKMEIVTAAFDSLEVVSQYGMKVKADMFLNDVKEGDFDFLVIPGGRAVYEVLNKSEKVSDLIKEFNQSNKLIAAICAGPSQIGKVNLLVNRNYTCFPTVEEDIVGGTYCPEKGVITDGNIITAKSMAYSFDFALEIVEYLLGPDKRKAVYKSIYGIA